MGKKCVSVNCGRYIGEVAHDRPIIDHDEEFKQMGFCSRECFEKSFPPKRKHPTNDWDRITGFCCSTCMFYAPKTDDRGVCRRHAPTLQGYPVVYSEVDWCGDHKIGTNPSKEKFENKE